jgi:hypothetical protein
MQRFESHHSNTPALRYEDEVMNEDEEEDKHEGSV